MDKKQVKKKESQTARCPSRHQTRDRVEKCFSSLLLADFPSMQFCNLFLIGARRQGQIKHRFIPATGEVWESVRSIACTPDYRQQNLRKKTPPKKTLGTHIQLLLCKIQKITQLHITFAIFRSNKFIEKHLHTSRHNLTSDNYINFCEVVLWGPVTVSDRHTDTFSYQ